MHIESVTLENFRCFGASPVRLDLGQALTAFIGNNGTGKTAAAQALQRVFGISADERTVRLEDFHVPATEAGEVASRSLSIDVVLAFPELSAPDGDRSGVPDFFARMVAEDDGTLKCRVVLTATWTKDATLDGSIETHVHVLSTLARTYRDDEAVALPPSERSRVQVVYVPASRDGARQVSTFLRGRLWRAARWSEQLRERVVETSKELSDEFHDEDVTRAVESAFTRRWSQLHGGGTHGTPRFQPIEPDLEQFLQNTELMFEPDHHRPGRSARMLSDGQRSLLYLALTTASLDLEAEVVRSPAGAPFDVHSAYLPALTVLVVEEPENNLAPFYLSRIVGQLLELGASSRAQVLLSSHSSGALTRIEPADIRHFRLDQSTGATTASRLSLPAAGSDAEKYVREAVRAHPELYFARFVVLGEGDSEQIMLPAIARASGVDLDPSFIAMVPLGGRHTQHFWRLLTDLGIPHATLLDMDYGRGGGGANRLREASSRLSDVGIDVFDGFEAYSAIDEIDLDSEPVALRSMLDRLEEFGVFFSFPLDLDMSLYWKYVDAYTALEGSERGPSEADARDAVLGTDGRTAARDDWDPADPARKRQLAESLRWYRYLFLTRSKPSTHLRALGQLDSEQLKQPPEELARLVQFIRAKAGL